MKIGIAPEKDIEKCLETIREDNAFYARSRSCDAIELRFATEELAFNHLNHMPKNEKMGIATHLQRERIAKIRIENIPLK